MTKWLGATVLLVGAVVALAGTWSLPLETAQVHLSENGPIELASVFLWFVLALALVVLALAGRRELFFLGFVAALAGGRELDLQGAFTSEAVTNLRYWTRDVASLSEKVLVAIVLASLLAAFVVAARHYWRGFAKALIAGQGFAWSMVTIVLAAPSLMLVDGTARYYRDLTGDVLDPAIHILSIAVEEVGELMLPIIGFVALGQYLERVQAALELSSGNSRSAQGPEGPDGT